MKRSGKLRSAVIGLCLAVAGGCFILLSPQSDTDITIIKEKEKEVLAVSHTTTPMPSPSASVSATSVPSKAPSGADKSESSTVVEKNLVNINTAGPEELMSLPGIGGTRAAAIIGYRAVYGNFQKIEDIMLVSGIKDGVYSKIKDRICTGYE